MARLRSVSTAFWSDPFIEELTPIEKLLFLYLITNEKTNMLGVYEASNKKISFETGIELEMVSKCLERFESLGKVKRVGNWIILVNFLKHQSFNTNMKKSAIDTYNGLPNELKINDLDINKSNPSEGFERLSKGFGMVRKVEVEYKIEYKEEVEGEEEKNDNNFPLDLDSLFSLDVLKQNYLSNKDIVKAVIENKENGFKNEGHLKEMIDIFIPHLASQGETVKTPKDFAKHFRDWNKKKTTSETSTRRKHKISF